MKSEIRELERSGWYIDLHTNGALAELDAILAEQAATDSQPQTAQFRYAKAMREATDALVANEKLTRDEQQKRSERWGG